MTHNYEAIIHAAEIKFKRVKQYSVLDEVLS